MNRDGVVDSQDIDDLFAELGSTNSRLDLDGAETLGQDDVDFLVEDLLGTNYGDANLDGAIDFADFLQMAENLAGKGTWSSGDFDGDGVVGFKDFLKLAENFRNTRNDASSYTVS